nr:hypothetical protein [uncultured Halomonas sp.]
MSKEHAFLQAEISELKSMLETIPPEQVIDRISLEARLESAESQLTSLGAAGIVDKLLLTFRGRPVNSTRGMAADFGGKAVETFTSAVSTVLASINGDIGERGPVSKKDFGQLMITGTAVGSFGFELEVPSQPPTLFEDDDVGVGDVVETIRDLFKTAARGSDDELTELVDVIHPRAVKKVSEFLGHLESNGAFCGIQFKGKSFRFTNSTELSSAVSKLKEQNMHEGPAILHGCFLGILPHSRMFEFSDKESGKIIKGKIGSKQIDPDHLSERYLRVPVKATFRSVRVGEGKPKYTLMKLEDIALLEKDDSDA